MEFIFSPVSIITRLRARRSGFDSRQGGHPVQTGSGVHPTSYPTGTGGSFARDKATGLKPTTHLHLVPRI